VDEPRFALHHFAQYVFGGEVDHRNNNTSPYRMKVGAELELLNPSLVV
jgi:hypothetical protein